MSKVKVSELKCFGEVSKILGDKVAKSELFKAVNSSCKFRDYSYIKLAFYWSNTPQGFDFWHDISNGINPYDN